VQNKYKVLSRQHYYNRIAAIYWLWGGSG